MAQIINTTRTTGITLTGAANPLTIATTGAIEYAAGTAIYGPNSQTWTVFNAGTVTGKVGIDFTAGGYVSNASSGTIAGSGGNGVEIFSAAGKLTNDGLVTGSHWGVYLAAASGTVVNTGTLTGGAYAVVLGNGGVVSNAATGLITSSGYNNPEAIRIARASGTIVNAGTLFGSYHAIELDAGGSIVNTGTIVGSRGGIRLVAGGIIANSGTISGGYDAVTMSNGGTILNAAGGLIASTTGGQPMAIKVKAVPAYVQNAGTVFGASDGVVFYAGGNVVNTGTITGVTNDGIYLEGGGTVVNSGTIGGGADAVQFVGNFADRLVITPGAVFHGLVTGGSGTNTMELAGNTAANLSGLGTQFTGFTQFAIDSGADWTLTSTNTLAAGSVFTDAGTLTLQGPVTANETILFTTANGVLQIGAPIADAGIVDGFSAGDQIVLDGVADATGATIVNGNTVEITRGGNPAIDLTFNPAGNLSGAVFAVAEQDGNATLTVSGITRTTGITLTAATNPLTIQAGASYTYATGTEIYGPNTQPWTVFNAGLVSGVTGIDFAAGGYVGNASPGTITGSGNYGINIAGADGTVVNAGTISAAKTGINIQGAPGTAINSGTIFETGSRTYGIYLAGGGEVTNTTGGIIHGLYGVVAVNAEGTVTNAGTIQGSSVGVYFASGGIVTNAAGGTIAGAATGVGVYINGNIGTVINNGLITGENAIGLNDGGTIINGALGHIGTTSLALSVVMVGGGLVSNAGLIVGSVFWTGSGSVTNTGTITSGQPAIDFSGSGTVTNSGSIHGSSAGVFLQTGGFVSNAAGGVISATTAVRNAANLGTVQNTGTMIGTTNGVALFAGGSVVNAGTISGVSNVGVYLKGGGTVANSATISGGSGAVQFVGTFSDRLIVSPGAVFQGAVTGGAGTNTMELAGSTAATLSGLGTQFTGFTQFAIDSGANWTLASGNTLAASTMFSNAGTLTLDGTVAAGETISFTNAAGTLQLADPTADMDTVANFVTGDAIVLDAVTDATAANLVNGNTVEVTRSGNSPIDLTFAPSPKLAGATFHVTGQGGNAIVTAENLACFAEGTRIATPAGPRNVETLHAGDPVCIARGDIRPVRWIGFRRIDLARHPDPSAAKPIIVGADAFADGMPVRDLRLSPDHAVLRDGMLIPVRLLLNGGTIRRDDDCRAVTYYHVELDTHDILLAEGLPVESYLDTGNRGVFQNAAAALVLHPTFAPPSIGQVQREAASCAPFVTDPARVEPLWRHLARRSVQCGLVQPHQPETTTDPALCIAVGQRMIRPAARCGDRHVFILPAGAGLIRLVSRHAVPSEARPWIEERRRLGVMIARLTVRDGGTVQPIPLDHPDLHTGWWEVERHGPATMRRWTDGAAVLPVSGSGPVVIEVEVAGTLDYPIAEAMPERRRGIA